MNEALNRMKDLYEYKSEDTKTTNKQRIIEAEDGFKSTLDTSRKITK